MTLETIADIRSPLDALNKRIGRPHRRTTGLHGAHCVENARSGGSRSSLVPDGEAHLSLHNETGFKL